MSLVNMNSLISNARNKGRGLGSFSVCNMEMVIGAIRAAEELDTPIIIQIAEGRLKNAPLEYMGPMMVEAARKSKVDIAVHLDHAGKLDVLNKALEYGFTSVMIDGSTHPFEENVHMTKEAIDLASKYGAGVEAELGLVGKNEEGTVDYGVKYTDPDAARRFCEETKVDALAIAIGNAHGNYPVAPRLAFDVLKQISQRVDTPLVLHGGSGISDADFQEAIRNGITKINIFTASLNGLMKKTKEYIESDRPQDFFTLSSEMALGVYETVKHHIRVFNMEIIKNIG